MHPPILHLSMGQKSLGHMKVMGTKETRLATQATAHAVVKTHCQVQGGLEFDPWI